MTNLTAPQARVLALITEHGTVSRNFGGGGAPKGFNITAAESLKKLGLVVITADEEAGVHRFTLDPRVADVEEAHTLALQEDAHRVIAQAFPAEVAAAAETNPEYAPAQFLAEVSSWTVEYRVRTNGFGGLMRNSTSVKAETPAQALAAWFERATSTDNLYDVSAYREGSGQGSANWHEGDPTPTVAPATEKALKECQGDWTQRGCASGKPSVHRVTTHGATRDVCAYHSPFDVDNAHPVGWVQPEDYWPTEAAPAPASPSVQAHFGGWDSGSMAPASPSVPAGGFPSPYAVAFLIALTRGSGRWVPSKGELAEADELEGRGFVVKIPGINLRVLTDAGREFTREHILSVPASS